MRRFHAPILMAAVAAVAAFVSCGDDDDLARYAYYGPNATVTIKPLGENAFYMQLDDTTTMYPTNVSAPPYGDREVRAFVNFTEVERVTDRYTMSVRLNYVDSFLTKESVPFTDEEGAAAYGDDPVEIIPCWFNVFEDGYLTLYFSTLWGKGQVAHYVNLLTGVNPDDPYEVEFRHNAFGDVQGQWGNGVVAFKVSGLPEPDGDRVTITLRYNSFDGEKTVRYEDIRSDYLAGGVVPASAQYGPRLR